MTAFRHWLATLGVFAFGGATQAYMNPVEAAVPAAEVEQACEWALQANTIEALEEFLHKYPPGLYRNDVACYALALGALEQFGSDNDPTSRNNNDKDPGGYGR